MVSDATGSLASRLASPARICAVACPGAPLTSGTGTASDYSPEQLLLGSEVVHDQARVHSGGRGHGPDGGPLVPGGGEDLGSGVEDARFGASALLGARTGPGTGHASFYVC